MRALTASLIVLGLTSLSCSGLDAWTVSGARGRLVTSPGADAAQPAADVTPLVAQRRVTSDRIAAVASHALDDRIRREILAELESRHTGLAHRELVRLSHTIVGESARYGLDPTLVLAVIQVESGGYHLAVSPVGALGLMQLLPSTAEELARKHDLSWRGANSLFDPVLNVKLGTAYLSQLERKYGSMNTALAAYNWGPGRIDRRLRRGASVPRVYPEQVMKFYEAGEKPSSSRS